MILAYYNSELAACLMHLYPDIGLEREKCMRSLFLWVLFCQPNAFIVATNPSVATNLQGRIFFDRFAATHGFDPLVAANWYKVTYHSLSKHQVLPLVLYPFVLLLSSPSSILTYFPGVQWDNSTIQRQIIRLPDAPLSRHWSWGIGIFTRYPLCTPSHPSSLSIIQSSNSKIEIREMSWINISAVILRTPHKSYFDDFAAAQGFNPLIPDNWYNVPFSQVFLFILSKEEKRGVRWRVQGVEGGTWYVRFLSSYNIGRGTEQYWNTIVASSQSVWCSYIPTSVYRGQVLNVCSPSLPFFASPPLPHQQPLFLSLYLFFIYL